MRSEDDDAAQPTQFRRGLISGVMLFPTLIALVSYVSVIVVAFTHNGLEPARTIGMPLRVTHAGVDAVFLMTAQQEQRVVGGRSPWLAYHGFETVTHIDLWRFDESLAQPTWRKRLVTEHRTNIFNYALLGAEADRLWVFMHEPLILSAANGKLLVNAAAIEASNAPLRGVIPRDVGHYKFYDGYGLAFTAADARAWLLDATSLAATPWPVKGMKPRATAIAPAPVAGSQMTSFQKRGLLLTRDWLGVLTDDEAAVLNREVQVPGAEPGERRGAAASYLEATRAPPELTHSGPKRYRLWRAKVEQVSAAPEGWPKNLPDRWGKRPRYSGFTVFEKSPEYLQAGLLRAGRADLPLLLTDPDSVVVLHRDRIDALGRLRLARMAGPDGRVLWDTRLPLTTLDAVIPGGRRVVLFGSEKSEPSPGGASSSREWLVSLDTSTGAAQTFDVSNADAPATSD